MSTDLTQEKSLLSGKLGLKEIWAIGVGSVVGDGIFLLMGAGGAIGGPLALLSYFVAGVLLMCILIALGEMSVGMPAAGALWVWCRRMLGNLAGFISGVSYAAGWVIAGGSVGIAIGKISTGFIQLGSTYEMSVIIWAIIWCTVFAGLNYIGVEMASKTQLYLVLGLVGFMLVFGIVGFLSGKIDYSNYRPFAPFGFGAFFPTLAFGTYAYMGALTLATAGAECKDPKDIPKGLVLASITFLVIYTVSMAAMFGLLNYKEMGVLESPFVTAGMRAFGPGIAFIINIAAWVAAATCLIGGTFYSAPRVLYSMAENGILPKKLAELNKNRVPSVAIIWVYIISIILVVIGFRSPGVAYVALTMLLVFAWMVCEALGIIAGIKYRQKYKAEVEKLPWKQPLYPLFPILGLIGVGVIVYGTFRGAESSLLIGIVFTILLVVYYYAYGKKNLEMVEREQGGLKDI